LSTAKYEEIVNFPASEKSLLRLAGTGRHFQ
jgi:hypothetical protein